jgi:hypothetical protein
VKAHYTLTVELNYEFPDDDALSVSDNVDTIVAHLHDVLDAEDLMVLLETTHRKITVSMLVEASPGESAETTIGKGLGDIRTALHYSGGHTPAWPLPSDFAFCAISLDKARFAEEPSPDERRLISV